MRLTDLDPGWSVTSEGHAAGRTGMGITFKCPCGCPDSYLGVFFANPTDGGAPAPPEIDPKPRWQRTGDTFETLTLTPSIDASKSGHWHGHITNGNIT